MARTLQVTGCSGTKVSDLEGRVTGLKRCPKCDTAKERTEFNVDQRRRDGLTPWCRQCSREADRLRRQKLQKLNEAGETPVIRNTKYCPKCSETKTASEFYKNKNNPDGLRGWCIECWGVVVSENHRRRNEEHRRNNKNKDPYQEGVEQKCYTCKHVLPAESFQRDACKKNGLNGVCKECDRKKRLRERLVCLQAYGGEQPSCCCCGEMHVEFLGIDHVAGGGRQHRDELRKQGTTFYRWLKKQGFPVGYRVLCHNCNQSLGLYGYCPHQKKSE